jgi:hypothetical protein
MAVVQSWNIDFWQKNCSFFICKKITQWKQNSHDQALDFYILNKSTKFQLIRCSESRDILVTDFENAVLRKTRLKFQVKFTTK